MIGLDLDDDAEDHDHHEDGAGKSGSVDDNGGEGSEDKSDGDAHKEGGKSSTETVMGHLASSTLAAVLQMVVRTGLMGLVSVLLSRYTILVSGFLFLFPYNFYIFTFILWRMMLLTDFRLRENYSSSTLHNKLQQLTTIKRSQQIDELQRHSSH